MKRYISNNIALKIFWIVLVISLLLAIMGVFVDNNFNIAGFGLAVLNLFWGIYNVILRSSETKGEH